MYLLPSGAPELARYCLCPGGCGEPGQASGRREESAPGCASPSWPRERGGVEPAGGAGPRATHPAPASFCLPSGHRSGISGPDAPPGVGPHHPPSLAAAKGPKVQGPGWGAPAPRGGRGRRAQASEVRRGARRAGRLPHVCAPVRVLGGGVGGPPALPAPGRSRGLLSP